ncbi:MAG: hemolysin D [Calditrichaeota bacterium]|nr:MAG: hemolysin D [Calditrichota bacterium]
MEEKLNVISHSFGLFLSVIALVVLVVHASVNGNVWHIVSFAIFGVSLITLYSASTFYHSAKEPKVRSRLRIFDHAAIYVLIAGTYTPFTLITLSGTTGWVIFGITWSLAVTGIILKLFFTGRFKIVSTLMYVFMGWLVVFAIKPLVANLSFEGLVWLFAGGMAYTVGAVLYSIKKIKFNHAIFHFFVLGGSISHFISVFFYSFEY